MRRQRIKATPAPDTAPPTRACMSVDQSVNATTRSATRTAQPSPSAAVVTAQVVRLFTKAGWPPRRPRDGRGCQGPLKE